MLPVTVLTSNIYRHRESFFLLTNLNLTFSSSGICIDYYAIPTEMVGLVIGRGGERLRRIELESGCIRITIERFHPAMQMCTLESSIESINVAKQILNNIVQHANIR